MPRDIRLTSDRWVRHRCPGATAATAKVFFNDFGVRIDTLPNVTRGCPFCWRDFLSLRSEWWEHYRRHAPTATPEDCAAAVVDVVRRLNRSDAPTNGICSHFGVSPLVSPLNVSINVSSGGRGGKFLQITMDKSLYPRPAILHRARAFAVADALVSQIVDSWNGGDSQDGISVVLDRRPPASLAAAQEAYRAQLDVFNPTAAEKAGWKAFDAWYRAPLRN